MTTSFLLKKKGCLVYVEPPIVGELLFYITQSDVKSI